MTPVSTHRRLRHLSSLVVLAGAAGALAAPSALARPVDMTASTPSMGLHTTAPSAGAYTSLAKAERILIGGHNGPAPYQGAIRAGGSPQVKATTQTDGTGSSFSWSAAGIGAAGTVLGAGIILLVEREASRRRVRMSQA